MRAYEAVRESLFQRYWERCNGAYQSPSDADSPLRLMNAMQAERPKETYLRYNFGALQREQSFNGGHATVGAIAPRSLLFSSGMAAITTLLVYLRGIAGLRRVCVAENSYFESIRLLRRMFHVALRSDGTLEHTDMTRVVWVDYPTSDEPNCFPNLRAILANVVENSQRALDRDFYVVIDYTVSAFAFDLRRYLRDIPENVHVFLVASLQKHMSYGLDIAPGGALTVYSWAREPYAAVAQLRTHCGAMFTEKSSYLLPAFRPDVVRQIVIDSGKNAAELANALVALRHPGIKVHYSFGDEEDYTSSLIFVELLNRGSHIGREAPFPVDRLVDCIVERGRTDEAPLVHGESFGSPMTRFYHFRGTAHHDVRSIRIAVGYDEELATAALPSIVAGFERFLG